jgi:phosphopantetheinyl transferase
MWAEPLSRYSPVSRYSAGSGLVCVRAQDRPDEPAFENSVLAVLSCRERVQWEGLRTRAVRKRIGDWQRGRKAAKQAVMRLVWDQTGVELAPSEVEIVPGQWGQPRVEGDWARSLNVSPVVSISHSGDTAVALAAAGPSTLVGIDLELAERTAHGVREIVFQAAECNMIDALDPALQQEWVLRLWCAKEAVGKALGRGFSAGFKALEVTQFEPHSGTVLVELRGRLTGEFPALRGRPLAANTSALEDFIVASVVVSGGSLG